MPDVLEETTSLAALLDDVRGLIVDARGRGEDPRYLLLPRVWYAVVNACKARDRERGMPVMVLGMEIVSSDDEHVGPRIF
jgi:hypothetical protein